MRVKFLVALHFDLLKNLKLITNKKKKIGKILSIQAFVPNDWDKYSVHVIDPLIRILPNSRLILESKKFKKKHKSTLIVKYKKNLILTITSSGQKIRK